MRGLRVRAFGFAFGGGVGLMLFGLVDLPSFLLGAVIASIIGVLMLAALIWDDPAWAAAPIGPNGSGDETTEPSSG